MVSELNQVTKLTVIAYQTKSRKNTKKFLDQTTWY